MTAYYLSVLKQLNSPGILPAVLHLLEQKVRALALKLLTYSKNNGGLNFATSPGLSKVLSALGELQKRI